MLRYRIIYDITILYFTNSVGYTCNVEKMVTWHFRNPRWPPILVKSDEIMHYRIQASLFTKQNAFNRPNIFDHARNNGYNGIIIVPHIAQRLPPPHFKMADYRPEVECSTGTEWDIIEIPTATPTFSTMPESMVTLSTLPGIVRRQLTHISRWRTLNRKYIVSPEWNEISPKFERLPRHFRPNPNCWSRCQHSPTSADHRNSKWRAVNRK
jgi:hypothetical protein